MDLIRKLYNNDLDIIGDIHGEYDALITMIENLGYDLEGNHPNNRKLVFIGDFCDRGPDSPAVILLVKKLIENGNAQAVLGNHEINLLNKEAKDGAGWYFPKREIKDGEYEPFKRVSDVEREVIYDFLSNLPIALERGDLRVIHASWNNEKIEELRNTNELSIRDFCKKWLAQVDIKINETGLLDKYKAEQKKWKNELNDKLCENIENLPYTAEYNLIHQSSNPIKVLTAGIEELSPEPFYASGKWRFVRRAKWWDSYEDETPVIVGHYWRKLTPIISGQVYGGENLFKGISPLSWHGKNKNVFCVDYSVGARFKDRHNENIIHTTDLVALNWPEKTLTLENGTILKTEDFKNNETIRKNNDSRNYR